ncbi:hypothetical protein F4806DRAFT_462075 [Annulohypoxylon nitens]|nr:hypothetical protein F4806DRAFT_462075 [Annulohypoxylon nitens]
MTLSLLLYFVLYLLYYRCKTCKTYATGSLLNIADITATLCRSCSPSLEFLEDLVVVAFWRCPTADSHIATNQAKSTLRTWQVAGK